jgi:hypothetical protein
MRKWEEKQTFTFTESIKESFHQAKLETSLNVFSVEAVRKNKIPGILLEDIQLRQPVQARYVCKGTVARDFFLLTFWFTPEIIF